MDKDIKTGNSAPWWMLLLTVFGGMFLLRGGPSGTPMQDSADALAKAEARQGAEAADQRSSRTDRLRQPLREFLGLKVQESPAVSTYELKVAPGSDANNLSVQVQSATGDKATESATEQENQKQLKQRIQERIGDFKALIVTVADPFDTQSSYRFDLQIETLHRALASEHFTPDAFYLPWQRNSRHQRHRQEPGVLLYRKTRDTTQDGKSDVLTVYLVGELPTMGIHKEAFGAAAAEIVALGSECCYDDQEIAICGPTFSGSGPSLADAIRAVQAEGGSERLRCTVLSGSALSIDREGFLRDRQTNKPSTRTTFRSTLHKNELLQRALIEYVRRHTTFGRVKIAWLKEAGTGYGIEARRDRVSRNVEVIDFPVPLNIARARSTYASLRRQAESSQGKALPDRLRVPIPFDESGAAKDLPPVQTPNMTAASQEVILAQTLAAIRNEGIQYIGITMTDVRDPIFLAELVGQHCPNAQLLLVIGDLLDLHTEFRSAIGGALVASSHSLCPEEQDWCFPFGGRSEKVVLSQQSFYGLYNAVVLQRYAQRYPGALKDQENAIELVKVREEPNLKPKDGVLQEPGKKPPPLDIPKLLGYGQPFKNVTVGGPTSFKPAIWISLISPTGIWPLETPLKAEIAQSDYTLAVRIQPSDWKDSPPRASSFSKRIAPSSQLVLAGWVAGGILYLAAVFGWVKGNWGNPLVLDASKAIPLWMENWRVVFRLVMSLSFAIVIVPLFVAVSVVAFPIPFTWDKWHAFVVVWFFVSGLLSFALTTITVRDALWTGLVVSDWARRVAEATRQIYRRYTNERRELPMHRALVHVGKTLCRLIGSGDRNQRLELIRSLTERERLVLDSELNPEMLRGSATFKSSALNVVLLWLVASIFVFIDNQSNRSGWLFWFGAWTDLWNGISLSLTSQLIAVAIILLAYGFLLQLSMAQGNNLIAQPYIRGSLIRSQDRLKKIQELKETKTRFFLVFPIGGRCKREHTVAVAVLSGAAGFLWLVVLWLQTMNTLFMMRVVCFAFLIACVVWWWRFIKTIVLTNDFLKLLNKAAKRFGPEHSLKNWSEIMERNRDERCHGLQSLLFTRRPNKNDRLLQTKVETLRELLLLKPAIYDVREKKAEEDVIAQELILYTRQYFVHATWLLIGLASSGSLLFLAANSFPFNSGPLMQLTTSFMLLAIGLSLLWYYVRFDRDELVSLMVGSTPGHVEWNWSLLLTATPAAILTLVALISQAFPEMWHWLRDALEPLARTSG